MGRGPWGSRLPEWGDARNSWVRTPPADPPRGGDCTVRSLNSAVAPPAGVRTAETPAVVLPSAGCPKGARFSTRGAGSCALRGGRGVGGRTRGPPGGGCQLESKRGVGGCCRVLGTADVGCYVHRGGAVHLSLTRFHKPCTGLTLVRKEENEFTDECSTGLRSLRLSHIPQLLLSFPPPSLPPPGAEEEGGGGRVFLRRGGEVLGCVTSPAGGGGVVVRGGGGVLLNDCVIAGFQRAGVVVENGGGEVEVSQTLSSSGGGLDPLGD